MHHKWRNAIALMVAVAALLAAPAFGQDVGNTQRGLELMMSGFDLDVKLVSYRSPSQGLLQLAEDFGS